MRRFARLLLTALTTLSTLLLVLTLSLWLRSHLAADIVSRAYPAGDTAVTRTAASASGRFLLAETRRTTFDPAGRPLPLRPPGDFRFSLQHPQSLPSDMIPAPAAWHGVTLARADDTARIPFSEQTQRTQSRVLASPYWPFALVTALLPTARLLHRRKSPRPPLLRRVLAIASVLSLTLLLTTLTLWFLTRRTPRTIIRAQTTYIVTPTAPMPVATNGDQSLCFDGGRIAYTRYLNTRRDVPPGKFTEQNVVYLLNDHSPQKTWAAIVADPRAVSLNRPGFQLARIAEDNPPLQLDPHDLVHNRTQIFLLILPFWSLAVCFALLPARYLIRFARHLRRRRRHRTGHCPYCGYDLRHSPDRCPECGHVPTAPPPRL
jgi:hypothetical protein